MTNVEKRKKTLNKVTEQHLIKLDFDGTTSDSTYNNFNPRILEVVQRITRAKARHKVCLTTGRNYRAALPLYRKLGQPNFLAVYNGAYIVNPSRKNSTKVVTPISNKMVKNIVDETVIKSNLINTLIDAENLETITTSMDPYYKEIFVHCDPDNGVYHPHTKVNGIDEAMKALGNRDVLQLVLEFANDREKLHSITTLLHRKYKSAISFYYGNKSKNNPNIMDSRVLVTDPEKVIIKIRNSFAGKGMGTRWIASYYGIDLNNVIAFGNAENDFGMMRAAGKGIVTYDSPYALQALAYDNTVQRALNSDAVAEYLADYFGYFDLIEKWNENK